MMHGVKMMKKFLRMIITLLLLVALTSSLVSVPAYAKSRTLKQIKKLNERAWDYSPYAIAPPFATSMVDLHTNSETNLICYLDIVRTDNNSTTLFTGGMTPDGDFHVGIQGAAGDEYHVVIGVGEPNSYNTQSIEAVVVAQTENAYVQKVGTQYVFNDLTIREITEYYSSPSSDVDYFVPGEKWFNPAIFNIDKGVMTCCYLKGTKQQDNKKDLQKTSPKAEREAKKANSKYDAILDAYNMNQYVDQMDPNKGAVAMPIGATGVCYPNNSAYTEIISVYNNVGAQISGFEGGLYNNGDFELFMPANVSTIPSWTFELDNISVVNGASVTSKLNISAEFSEGAKITKIGDVINLEGVKINYITGWANNSKVSEYYDLNAKKLSFSNGVITIVE